MTATPTLIILAGGASSRMWPLREKSLLRFGPEPLLISQLRRYHELGFTRAVIVGNPENVEDIRAMVAPLRSMQIDVAVQVEPKGMGDAILQAEPLLRPDEAIYINQVHDVVDSHLHLDALAGYSANPEHSFMVGYEMEDYFPGGYLVVDADRRITGMVEKPGPANRPSNLVNIVAHVHSQAGPLLEAIRAEYARDLASDDHYERAMDRLMKTSVFRAVPYAGHWSALKFPWHTLDILDYF
ncbi:MAG: NTP transferase domain-containing protein, partial [Anaerolineae bacterium]|nr:NTP transferase domain-containing protein [Anaerolineae bacterium]